MSGERVLFVDRDGTLIEEPPDEQVDRLDKIKLLPGVIPALIDLKRAGLKLVMVTNQDGLGTPSLPAEAFEEPHRFMLELFASQGVVFDSVFVCPHFKHENCGCRKPKLGMVEEYLERTPSMPRAASWSATATPTSSSPTSSASRDCGYSSTVPSRPPGRRSRPAFSAPRAARRSSGGPRKPRSR